MYWYLEVLKKYAVFDGRACRQEYWYFVIFNFTISVVLSLADFVTNTYSAEMGVGLLSGIYSLVVLVPGIAVSVRRLHDIGRSGWWVFISLVPLIGALVLIYFMAKESEPGINQYGNGPQLATA